MSHKRHYQLLIDGEVYDVYCDTLPVGKRWVSIAARHSKIPQRRAGPIYDPNDPNSIEAAILYESVHHTTLWRVWKYLYDHNGAFVSGADLIELYGTAALERVRELRHKYGWPIEAKSPEGPGVWWYRLNLQQQPRRRRIIRRS